LHHAISVLPIFIIAQPAGGLGTWRVHLPYWQNKTIAAIGSTVYVGSSSSVFHTMNPIKN